MVSYRVADCGEFEAYDQHGVMAKLGEGLVSGGPLPKAAMDRTLEALRLFREIVNTERMERVLPITTSPVREASNGVEFVKRAKLETGFDFRVLSGREEALLSFLGAAKAMDLSSSVLFDLGGGSLEITATKESRLSRVLSLRIGALRLTQSYSAEGGRYSNRSVNQMEEEILRRLPTRRDLGLIEGTTLAGVGGSVRALARYDQELREYPFAKVHNYVLKREAVESMFEGLAELSTKEISRLPAIGGGRAETIVAGALVVRCLMEKLSIDELHASTHGLRDGVLSASLDDHYRYKKGPIGEAYIVRSARIPNGVNAFPHSHMLVQAFVDGQRLQEGHVRALAHAVKLATGEGSSFDPPTLFYSSMYEDSPLSHSCQLAASIAIVETRKPRMADWFLAKYRSLLDADYKGSIKKLASLMSIVELLEMTASSTEARCTDGSVTLTVTPTDGGFPERLFYEAATALEKEFDVAVTARVRKPQSQRRYTMRVRSPGKVN